MIEQGAALIQACEKAGADVCILPNIWPCTFQPSNMNLTHLYRRFLVSVIMVRLFQQYNPIQKPKRNGNKTDRDENVCGWRYMYLMISTFLNLNHQFFFLSLCDFDNDINRIF